MRSQAARIADLRSPAHQLGKQLNLPPSYLLIHRVTLSTIGVLCQLGATVRLRDELERWLPGFLAADEEPDDETAGAVAHGTIEGTAGRTTDDATEDTAVGTAEGRAVGTAVGTVEDITAEAVASAGPTEGAGTIEGASAAEA